ncbi:ABC transporter permease [Cellulophaga baltica]|jgi:putative ABC transport system permease protein|uniref:ABC transporter ATP-binding protein n=1 Tax=Cellulophaga baltica 18 TaxID=1348584 RepID=A0AAU8RL16_9FLAO|nr:ABC transporter permease [Cellulophaga baltica]AIY13109.1 ABC transporter ATP-binding protein [Cellulophaga baltica NN016038]AIZ41478.1 ABC transporter ATP-binding protein [Cellulophaga baltica 18]MBA6313340.1 ABC transporter permease [Cellulophaga baltica]MCR1023691.1 ABC transporter permease [Cellulophaga baltica]
MFDLERWQEIFDTIRKNKLRTFLTGLSVASGIFILVILLGFGQGMQNGIAKEFESDSATSIWIWTETTQKAHKGLNPGRQIQFRDEDYTTIVDKMDLTLDQKSAFYLPQNITTTYKDDALIYRVMGTTNGAQFLENQDMLEGRFITIKDESQVEKVAVISDKIQREAFTDVDNPVGEYIKISNIPFKIIGVYKDKAGEREENRIFIPITTAQKVFNGADKLDNLVFSSPPAANFDEAVQQSITLKTKIDTYLRQAHSIAPDDEGGIGINNQMENAKRFYALTGNIKLFFWFVGLCTIIAGVVGVSNIMLIVVKERTKEIGIRKALGAKPWSIIGMILHESVFVTAISGFTGLIFSMGLLELIGPNIEVDYIVNPSVDFNVAMSTVFLLVVAGAIAGFFPAWRAASIHTIDALRDE